jgi:hypothetical protein
LSNTGAGSITASIATVIQQLGKRHLHENYTIGIRDLERIKRMMQLHLPFSVRTAERRRPTMRFVRIKSVRASANRVYRAKPAPASFRLRANAASQHPTQRCC